MAIVCAHVIGYDASISVGGLSGNFELNVMLPMVAHSLLEAIRLLANASRNLADRSVSRIVVREDHINSLTGKNPILVTTLNPLIGYDLAAKIAKKAFAGIGLSRLLHLKCVTCLKKNLTRRWTRQR